MKQERIALVTGGVRGIGKAICMALQAEGYKVAANYAHNDAAAKAFESVTHIPVFKWDVADFKACEAGVKKVEKAMGGPIDILVNNAGITRDGMLHKLDFKAWQDVMNVNLGSCFNMAHAVVDGMREKKFGRVINISSINAQAGQLGQTNYSASKAGIIGFTKAFARETASKGITVNAIAPGYIDTDMVADVPQKVLDQIIAAIPVGRLGKPEEIARMVVFLADDASSFMTGATFTINGGQYLQ